ncbi:MAG: hypothetical protein HKN45_02105 [Flavobacteriales bacterium]|nr:hypothetical protein [Flavobacteriales bacterium]
MIFRITFLLIIISSVKGYGQSAETIRSGRPGQSIGPFSIGQSIFQVQSGFFFNQIGSSSLGRDVVGNNSVLRFGLSELIEISAVFDYSKSYIEDPRLPDPSNTSLQLGGRYHLLDQQGIVPNLALQSRVGFYNEGDFELSTVSIIATSHSFGDFYTFFSNWKMITREGDDAQYAYTANLSRTLSDKVGVFAEIYGSLSDFEVNYDAGFSYLVNDDLQLDLSAGIQDGNLTDDWFIDLGVSWRLMPKD